MIKIRIIILLLLVVNKITANTNHTIYYDRPEELSYDTILLKEESPLRLM